MKQTVRLSKNVIPIEYDLKIRPDLKNFTFEGVETITLSILKKTKTLTLHSKELEIETAHMSDMWGKISYDEKSETATFTFPENIPAGKNKLTIVFKGILNDKMRGFYRSRYYIDGKEHHMATTQFEATDARRAFPCFDEPAQKAVFHVSLVVPKGKTAISNTLPKSVEEHESGFEVIRFHPTPKMSTYLLAFIVGDFEYIEKKTKTGVQVRVYTTHGKKHQAGFALDCAVKTLEFYEKYFDIKYPLNTLDMIAIPDFQSGAMENWGAVTYRESALLVDENHSSVSNKQWVALVIAHELAHQWFGNLVTMEWWTHLWLNEGFATYIEYLAVDKLFPKWDIWTQFSTNDLGRALHLDALLNTHPIEIPVHHPDEIGEIFDEVSYAKGASVIRMLASYLGEKDFRAGLHHYLKKHSYKNTETLHLWQAFEKVSGKPVAKMMRNWTSKPGYPVVKAEIKNGKLALSQERFFASPISKKKSKDKTIWQVPLHNSSNVQYQSSQKSNFLPVRIFRSLKNPEIGSPSLAKPLKKFILENSYLKVNFGETGFFRTAYSKELLEKLKMPVERKILSPRDRLGVIRDLFALSEAGTIPTTDALEFLSAYKNPARNAYGKAVAGGEDNYTVWLEIALGLARLEQLIVPRQARHLRPTKSNLDKLILDLFSPTMKRLGWSPRKNEMHTDTLLRSLCISRLGRSGHTGIINKARAMFKTGKINPDIRGAVYSVVASSGGMKEYKIFIEKYKKETLHEEKNRIGGVLGDFSDPKILKLTCEFAMSKHVRTQDTVGILSSIGANPEGRDIWLKCIKLNWKILVSRYGDGGHTLARLIKAISGSAEEKHLKSFKEFFATHDAPGAKRAIQQVLERLEGNTLWLKRDGKKIEGFLE
ncbi:hypothetical protein A2W67_03555 [Candidatus Nomurabacteria bacterium RIFCSPLOWO2_02_40_28]|uniref:Aminopeptidase n=2 Tax=Candidatus Nomuraibacteriota TaxID=1752729 RepID=A0A837HSV5_9BACT|nr:MAG: hypothetical protein UT27_C0004G0053 [Candidatus Nomurabacteria bacterium GW2011_GWD2_39_12]KKR20915.1 MAG: hypothetical protein UT51_C0001G0053 [Candidatus Nomurabacteria bacterium GW2011_GWC2_39_41]KKR37206.1 MAG: hypothetical protein UT70_C0002G0042 [Candidatus Nomurabacteria bacterium GW2011_GWE2_40_10]KKR38864.1 MAG: hypothetical protein UT73_C0001G0052 [Candidatus Nomurabacteria bacterium GW2011_GWB1_40_11]KKR59251.1 MAG: hypothetical protein UT98_C0002G0053 [Candidatus Nomurabact